MMKQNSDCGLRALPARDPNIASSPEGLPAGLTWDGTGPKGRAGTVLDLCAWDCVGASTPARTTPYSLLPPTLAEAICASQHDRVHR
jgi:hypothetical protein